MKAYEKQRKKEQPPAHTAVVRGTCGYPARSQENMLFKQMKDKQLTLTTFKGFNA